MKIQYLTALVAVLSVLLPDFPPARPLEVEIHDPDDPRSLALLERGTRDAERLPILFRGVRPKGLEQLQDLLRVAADPMDPEHQDRSARPLEAPSSRFPDGIYPCNQELVIRCAPTQDVAWVQGVMRAATFLSWRTRAEGLGRSPLISRISVGILAESVRPPAPLLADWREKADGSLPELREIILRVPRGQRSVPARDRRVDIRMGAYAEDLGSSRGFRLHPSNQDAATFRMDPPGALDRLREALSRIRDQAPDAQVRLVADPGTPFIYLHEMAQMVRAAELTCIGYSEITRFTWNELVGAVPAAATVEAEEEEAAPRTAVAPARRYAPAQIEAAVDRGLEWLMRHQGEDGRWAGRQFGQTCEKDGEACTAPGVPLYDVGITGLSLLAFVSQGNSHREGRYKEVVRRGLKWLKSQQDAEGCFGPRGDPHFVYSHAIATLVMAEVYGLSRSGIWKGSAQNGVNFIMQLQNPYKAWRYGQRPGDNDVSVTTWMVMALAAARAAGLDTSDTSLEWARSFVEEMTDPETGRTGYTRRGERPVRAEGRQDHFPASFSESLTAAGILIRVMSGADVQGVPVVTRGAELLRHRPPINRPDGSTVDMIYWYFGSLASFHLGGEEWTRWRDHLLPILMESQQRAGCSRGSWNPNGAWGADGGRIYSTSLMAVALGLCAR